MPLIEEIDEVTVLKSIKTTICADPLAYTIENFINDEDCQHFINISKDKIKQALVSGDKEGFVSKGRSGQNCWIPHDYDKITKRIGHQISELVGIPLENAEAFQVIYYGVEQEYRQHYDGWLFDGGEKSRRNMKWGGQRLVTALAYLNTVPKGGGTRFTKLGKESTSKKGKLLVFSNVKEGSNERHEMSEHAGMPIIEGEKWAFNLWFREKSRKVLYQYPEGNTPSTPTASGIDNICSLEALTNNSVKFSINTDINTDIVTDKVIDNTFSNVTEKKELLTSSDQENILKLCNFEDKDRSFCWVQNSKIPEIISKLENLVNIDASYFENMCVTKYKPGVMHKDHLDAYDLNSDKGKDYTRVSGQRLATITGFLKGTKPHKVTVKFPKLNENYYCDTGSVLYYNNCFDNTNERDQKYLKSYSVGETPTPPTNNGDLDDIDDDKSVSGVGVSSTIFNVYVREKSRTNDKILRVDGLLREYKSKEEIEIGSKGCSLQGLKGTPLPNYEDIVDGIYNKPLQENLRIPGFKMTNKAPTSYVTETLNKIKEIREKNGFLVPENLRKEYMIDEYNPVTVENVINPEIHKLVNNYFKENIQHGVYPLGDRQANRYKVLDEIMTRLLHIEFLPLIEKIVGRKMEATYTYLSAYLKGTNLPPHTDRADCEFTCSYIIGKPPESSWNIYVHKKKQPIKYKGRYDVCPPKEECIPVDCDQNGLMIFNGTDHIHFREELEYDYYNIVLLHYKGHSAL